MYSFCSFEWSIGSKLHREVYTVTTDYAVPVSCLETAATCMRHVTMAIWIIEAGGNGGLPSQQSNFSGWEREKKASSYHLRGWRGTENEPEGVLQLMRRQLTKLINEIYRMLSPYPSTRTAMTTVMTEMIVKKSELSLSAVRVPFN